MPASSAAHASPAATERRSSGSDASGDTNVWGFSPDDLQARALERRRPAGGVEPAGVVGGHALQQGGGHAVGQDAQLVGAGEGRVREVHGAQVGPVLAERGATSVRW